MDVDQIADQTTIISKEALQFMDGIGDDFPPVVTFFDEKGQPVFLGQPRYPEGEERVEEVVAELTELVAYFPQVVAISVAVDALRRDCKSLEEVPETLKDDPKAVDTLFVYVAGRDGSASMVSTTYHRLDDGRVEFEEPDHVDPEHANSQLMHLLWQNFMREPRADAMTDITRYMTRGHQFMVDAGETEDE